MEEYYRFLLQVQDAASPHRYQTRQFCVCKGEVVLDAGAAEGNFALEIVDVAEKYICWRQTRIG